MPWKIYFLILFFSLALSSPHLGASDSPASGAAVMFSPRDECGKVILDRINGAEKTIEIAMFHFTSRPLSRALVSAAKRGVQVRIFLDGDQARERYSKSDFLKKNGIAVKLERGKGLMHNKFCIIDGKSIITGSYNWTTSADLRNDENIIITEAEDILKAYRIQFEKYWRGTYVDETTYVSGDSLQKRR